MLTQVQQNKNIYIKKNVYYKDQIGCVAWNIGFSTPRKKKNSKQINFRHAMYGQIILIVIVSFLIPISLSQLSFHSMGDQPSHLVKIIVTIYILDSL